MRLDTIEHQEIGSSGVRVSRICLGTWAIGGWMWGGTDEAESVRTIREALDLGLSFLDTAPVYGFGRSEEIVGRAIEEHGARERVVIATKAGLQWDGDGRVTRNSTRRRILEEIDDSRRRLRTDVIDLYQIHWPDPLTPFEETAETMAELLDDGKIRAIGVSNFSPAQMEAFQRRAPLHSVQPPYNLFERTIEDDVLPYAREHGLSVLAYGALCRGLLSGRMRPDSEFEGDDLRNSDPKFSEPRFSQYLAAVDALERLANDRHGVHVLELAIRWLLDRGSIALWGARRPSQLEPVRRVFGWSLAPRDLEEIDRLIATHVTDPVGPEFMAPPARDAG